MFANTAKRGQVYRDVIFTMAGRARARTEEIGAEKVINGTVGALLDHGSLVTFPSVDGLIGRLDIKKLSAYSPQQGFPEFIEAATSLCFGEYLPDRPVAGVAVAGGLGGIRQAVVNYTEPGDSVLTGDWFWSPYTGIVEESGRKLHTYRMIDGDRFDMDSFRGAFEELASAQTSVFVLLNSPANNPTGYSLATDEWERLIDVLNASSRPVVLFLDSAYLDFAREGAKAVFRQLERLGDHVLPIVDYSLSKGLAKYGVRTAALLAFHRDPAVLEEFENVLTISNRACYGSVNSMGQLLAMALWNDEQALAGYREELGAWRATLRRRADLFLGALPDGLLAPYRDGFFASIVSDDPVGDVERLVEQDIFLVPLRKGVRVALCSIDEEKLVPLAEKIRRVLG